MIDFRSDTLTLPTEAMKEAMMSAKLGDDVFGEDPTVIELEQKSSRMFGKEAGLFCPSGTMTNQIAVKCHTFPGDEVICEKLCHLYNYEGGGIAVNSGCSVKLIDGNRGRFKALDVVKNINPIEDIHYPRTSLVAIENTCNKGGGSIWSFNDIEMISKICKKENLSFHLDGARIFNALVESEETAKEIGKAFDSISICLSKGLGAPCGSVLLGTKALIGKARRVRKFLGGAMRQSGLLAAAGIYALDHHVDRLKNDHRRAKLLAKPLRELSFVKKVYPVDTNIVLFEIDEKIKNEIILRKLKQKNILAVPMGAGLLRFVTYLGISDEDIEKTVSTLQTMKV